MKFYQFTSYDFKQLKEIDALRFAQLQRNTCALVCWKRTVNYFIEYAASLEIFSFIVTFELGEDLPSFTDLHPTCYFVFPTNIHNDDVFSFANRANCCLFNSEQMTIESRRILVEKFLQNGGKLINYCRANAQILLKNCVQEDQMLLLPYVMRQSEAQFLGNLYKNENKLYDFAVVCSLTPRRANIIDSLQKLGLKIRVITDCFGIERDKMIAQCRALLNIHANADYKIYESIRCDRWLNAGMSVICEYCEDAPTKHGNLLHIVPFDKIVEYCACFTFSLLEIGSTVSWVEEKIAIKLSNWTGFSVCTVRENDAQSLQFVYGANSQFKNVTDICTSMFNTDVIHLPKTIQFNRLFGDVCPNVPKNLYILWEDIDVNLPEIRKCDWKIVKNENTLSIEKV